MGGDYGLVYGNQLRPIRRKWWSTVVVEIREHQASCASALRRMAAFCASIPRQTGNVVPVAFAIRVKSRVEVKLEARLGRTRGVDDEL